MARTIPARFNALFGDAGWIATSATNAAVLQAAIDLAESGDFAAAEGYLTTQVSGEMVEAHLKIWFMRFKAFALREELLTAALEDYKAASPVFEADVKAVFDFERSVGRRAAPGGTAPGAVAEQIRQARACLEE